MTSHKRPPAPIEKLINNLAQSIHGSLTSASATEFIALAVDAYNGHRGDRPADDRDTLGDNFARVNGMTGARFSQPSAARGRRFSRGGIIDEIVPADNPPEQLGGQIPHVSPSARAATGPGEFLDFTECCGTWVGDPDPACPKCGINCATTAPTEPESWSTWQEVPEGRTVRAQNRHTYTKRDGILCIGTSTMKSCMATSTQHLAPFVAAEG